MPLKGFQRMQQHHLAVYFHKLLGHNGMHSFTYTAGKYQGNVVTLLHTVDSF
jgi:hypothetical protein